MLVDLRDWLHAFGVLLLGVFVLVECLRVCVVAYVLIICLLIDVFVCVWVCCVLVCFNLCV